MIRSHSAISLGVELQLAELMHQVVLQRFGPVGDVGDHVVGPVGIFLHAVGRAAGRFLEVLGHLAVEIQQPLEVVGVVVGFIDDQRLVVDRLFARDRRALRARRAASDRAPAAPGPGSRPAPARSAPAAPASGSCRISIDWIIRGASFCTWSCRCSRPKERRMVSQVCRSHCQWSVQVHVVQCLKPLPARQGVGQHFFVRVFQDAAGRDAAGQPRHLHRIIPPADWRCTGPFRPLRRSGWWP